MSPLMVDTTTRVVSGFVAFGSLLAFLTPVEPGSAAFHELYAYAYGGKHTTVIANNTATNCLYATYGYAWISTKSCTVRNNINCEKPM